MQKGKYHANDTEWENKKDGKRLDASTRHRLSQERNASFRCVGCNADIPYQALGTQNRNHCPLCLASRHVDNAVGDRASECASVMKPIAIATKGKGELLIVHECRGCGKINRNRVAGDDSSEAIMSVFEGSLVMDEKMAQKLEISRDKEGIETCLWGKR